MDIEAALGLLINRCGKQLSLIDVGARWGINQRWTRIGEMARILCFEPDAEECRRLNAACTPNVRYVPIGLADSQSERDLYITTEPACSSLYPPLSALYEHYPCLSIIKPERTVRIPCRRLDDVLADEQIEDVAAMKLDTQGSELSILQGAKTALKTCTLIDIEVEFNQLYDGQGLFCDVDRFLRDCGFVLWRLENLVHYAPEAVMAARAEFLFAADPSANIRVTVPNGQIFWAQAQYVRSEFPRTGADSMPKESATIAAVLAGLYGFWDLALELVRKTGDAEFLRLMRAAVIDEAK